MNILNRTKVIVGLLFVGLISNGSLLAQLPKVSDARLGVDCLRLSDGKRLYGFQLDAGSGKLRFAVERAWLRDTYPDYLLELEVAEESEQADAREILIERLEKWLSELNEDDLLRRFIETELGRVQQKRGAKSDSQFVVVDFERSEVREIKQAKRGFRQIAGLAFGHDLENVTITPAKYLKRELEELEVDLKSETVDLLDRLPAVASDSEKQWSARQALIEFSFGKELEFQGTGAMMVRKGDAKADLGQLLAQSMGANSASMIEQLGADLGLPEFAKFSRASQDSETWKAKVIEQAESDGFRGALVSRLDQNPLSNEVKVVTTFLAKGQGGDWFEAFEYVARADARKQSNDATERIKQDPQIQQVLGMVQGLGLNVGNQLDRALRHGAATEQAMRDAQAEFNEFLSKYGTRVDGASIPNL